MMPSAAALASLSATTVVGVGNSHSHRVRRFPRGTSAAAAVAVRASASRRPSRPARAQFARNRFASPSSRDVIRPLQRGVGGRLRPPRAISNPDSSTGSHDAAARGGDDGSHSHDPDAGDFVKFHRDEQGRPIDKDGNPIMPPANPWVAEMEKEWAATGYDERFFDDDWDENPEKNVNAEKPKVRAGPFFCPTKENHLKSIQATVLHSHTPREPTAPRASTGPGGYVYAQSSQVLYEYSAPSKRDEHGDISPPTKYS